MTDQSLPPLTFRSPSTNSPSPHRSTNSTSTFTAPPPTFLSGPWHVLHSTLPMWRTSRNVRITYTPLPSSPGSWDNLVTYQSLPSSASSTTSKPSAALSSSTKVKTLKGIEHPHPSIPAHWKWRGKGLLKIASSEWEVLGWGEEEGGWAVVWFEKTLFTPAGVDVLGRSKGGLGEGLMRRIRAKFEEIGIGEQGREMFEVRQEWEGEGDEGGG